MGETTSLEMHSIAKRLIIYTVSSVVFASVCCTRLLLGSYFACKLQTKYSFYFIATCRTFCRVLELPAENWHEYLDNWCCHGNDAISKLKGSLNPQLQDCFLGDWYIVVHSEAVDAKNIEFVKVSSQAPLSSSDQTQQLTRVPIKCPIKQVKCM